jgi:catechol 2,3-dioxygenase-like lactoylglutathione lyase family enzyme
MAQEFSLSLRYLPLRTRNLDGAREFYEKLLGLPACGEQPGDFVQLSVGDAALCVDTAGGGDPPAAIFAVTGLDQLCEHLADAGVTVDGPRHGHGGRYAVVHDPDGHELVFEETG